MLCEPLQICRTPFQRGDGVAAAQLRQCDAADVLSQIIAVPSSEGLPVSTLTIPNRKP